MSDVAPSDKCFNCLIADPYEDNPLCYACMTMPMECEDCGGISVELNSDNLCIDCRVADGHRLCKNRRAGAKMKGCGEIKPIQKFSKRRSVCKDCRSQYWCDHPFERMVNDSRNSDKKANREFKDENFATAKHLDKQYNEQGELCYYCKIKMILYGVNRKTNGDACTIERLDNDLAHIKSNVVLVCLDCNQLHKKHMTHQLMMKYGFLLKRGIMKACSSGPVNCLNGHIQNVTNFSKNKSRKDGLRHQCKACYNNDYLNRKQKRKREQERVEV
jgi:hypothetical protein